MTSLSADAHGDGAEHAHVEAESAVEEDEGDPEREEQLHADRVEREVHGVQRLGPQKHAGAEQEEHAREPQQAGGELGDDARGEEDRESLDDLLRGHARHSASRRGRLRPGPR